MNPKTYAESGVDIDRGDRFARFIAGISSAAVSGSIGGFAGGIELPIGEYRSPVLLSTTDGVGTKLIVASVLDDFSTIGIDLVAMCVNDLAVCGADPLVFLDYIACGAIHQSRLESVMGGIVRGCEIAGCTLSGGETAEMPDLYGPDDIDLAGFAVGIVEKDCQLPRPGIAPGDIVMGFPSSGIHSNGLSLARKAVDSGRTAQWREFLRPTEIYVNAMRSVRDHVKAAAHVTGGGLESNLNRVIPPGCELSLQWDWPCPSIFGTIMDSGDIPLQEMRSVFNMGIGLALVVDRTEVESVRTLSENRAIVIGEVTSG